MNYSQNTLLSEPFHNEYKYDVRLLYGLLLKVHFGYQTTHPPPPPSTKSTFWLSNHAPPPPPLTCTHAGSLL